MNSIAAVHNSSEIKLQPVILPVSQLFYHYKGKKQHEFLSRYARQALQECARLNNYFLKDLKKDQRGAPVPENGIHWSLSHKKSYVAAVCSNRPVGIDIEKIVPRHHLIFKKIATEPEWITVGEKTWEGFFRLFTAKEAVLKLSGEGLKDLGKCTLKRIVDDSHLVMTYKDKEWIIYQYRVKGHIVSIASNGLLVNWRVYEKPFLIV